MKKLIPITITAAALFLSACGLKDVVGPNAGGTTNSDSYQPVTKGSTWTYSVSAIGNTTPNSITLTMTGDVKTFNNVNFYKAAATSSDGTSEGYFGQKGSLYLTHDASDGTEEPYLDDSKAVGSSYTVDQPDPYNPGATIRSIGTILEKGITKTINSKTFKNVIHTRVETNYTDGTNTLSTDVTEYYIARGVGMVQIDAYLLGQKVVSQTITGYSIK